MRAQDRLAVIAFGDKVRTLLTGGESLKAVSAALDPLVCTDKTTAFYDAMNAAADLVLKTGNERCVAVVVSDGINTASGGMGFLSHKNRRFRAEAAVFVQLFFLSRSYLMSQSFLERST